MNTRKAVNDYLFLVLGAFLLAVGLNAFLVPCRLSSGGVSSVGTMLLYLGGIPISVTNLAVNAVLFLLGYRYVGKGAVIKTAVGIMVLSAFLEITKYFPTFGEDMFISTIIGGVLVGLGVGFVVKVDGSTGGSDFAGIILKRFFPHVSLATLIFFIDAIIIIISGIVFESYMITFYSAIAMFIASKVTDNIITMGDKAKSVYIMSQYSENISDTILNSFDRGVTAIYSKGAYSGNDGMMLLCAVSPKQLPKLVKKVKEIDKTAFIIISEAREVLGEGFKEF